MRSIKQSLTTKGVLDPSGSTKINIKREIQGGGEGDERESLQIKRLIYNLKTGTCISIMLQ